MSIAAPRLMTAREFAALPPPDDGTRQELVRGEITTMPPPKFRHGKYQLRIAKKIDAFVEPRRLGHVLTETGVVTEHGPDTVRGPGIAFWSAERIPLDVEPEGYPDIPADLCVEILSPDDVWELILEKVREYLTCGVRMVWVVDVELRTVTVYRNADEGRVLHQNATLSGDDVLPGFTIRVGELFN